jgi:hypothetical protein
MLPETIVWYKFAVLLEAMLFVANILSLRFSDANSVTAFIKAAKLSGALKSKSIAVLVSDC